MAVHGADSSPSAAPPVLRKLTLADAQRIAFQRNWDLLAAKSDVDIAVAGQNQRAILRLERGARLAQALRIVAR